MSVGSVRESGKLRVMLLVFGQKEITGVTQCLSEDGYIVPSEALRLMQKREGSCF